MVNTYRLAGLSNSILTRLVAASPVARPLNRFPQELPLLNSAPPEYDSHSNGPHEHQSHAGYSSISNMVRSQRRLGEAPIDLLNLPKVNMVQRRGLASKFTVTDRRDEVYSGADFEAVERAEQDPDANRAFTYFMVGATGVLGAMGAKSTVMNFLSTWSASSEALAMGQVELDLSAIPIGKSVVMKWRGKPIFIRHRTEEEVAEAQSVSMAELRDPQPDSDRTQKPEWIVMLGICTHLGCVPLANSGDYNGWYCPCHGSHYDVSGRIRKGPAPSNLEIPKYRFLDDEHIVVG